MANQNNNEIEKSKAKNKLKLFIQKLPIKRKPVVTIAKSGLTKR